MLSKCLAFPEYQAEAQAHLAQCYREQGLFGQAIDMYDQAMSHAPSHEVAFELGALLAQMQNYDKALMQFTSCIELGKQNLLTLDPAKLAEYYMHRAAVYEALGLLEHSKRDLNHIIEADPNFIQRYHSQALQLEELGQAVEASRIREFIQKLLC